MDWTWLWDQAKVASPFVATFCLLVTTTICAVLWRRHLQDLKTIESMNRSSTRAMVASAKSNARLATMMQQMLAALRNNTTGR